MQAFTIYEESISESRSQLQAITLIIGTLQTARVFGADNYDTLITKAALHGAKLLKKGQQATAVALASHLWWQTEVVGREGKGDKVRLECCCSRSILRKRGLTISGLIFRLLIETGSAFSSVFKKHSESQLPPSTN